MAPTGPNTGFVDALEIVARLVQRSHLDRHEVEDVIRGNCRRQGREEPYGTSMRRRVERLKGTLERCGVHVELLSDHLADDRRDLGWRLVQITAP